ncbi:DUF4279 domain-containing protein [Paraburkholderia xenovorans]|uniref:DUF4279 domain-containing protein n=1 Tax=Paraburkholderia xenovorans TaxID=36873 RepID=UPI0038BD8CFA
MHPNPPTPTNPNAGAFASLLITGDTVLPEFWTEYFGVAPSMSIVKGRPFILPSGRTSQSLGITGLWRFSSERAVESDQLTPHFQYLVTRLALPRDGLRELVQEAGAQVRLSCFWFNPSGQRAPDVPDDIQQLMESLGGQIDIDEYR